MKIKIFVFGKANCPFTATATKALVDHKWAFKYFSLKPYQDKHTYWQCVRHFLKLPDNIHLTFPQVLIFHKKDPDIMFSTLRLDSEALHKYQQTNNLSSDNIIQYPGASINDYSSVETKMLQSEDFVYNPTNPSIDIEALIADEKELENCFNQK